jgi:hypothetical protein
MSNWRGTNRRIEPPRRQVRRGGRRENPREELNRQDAKFAKRMQRGKRRESKNRESRILFLFLSLLSVFLCLLLANLASWRFNSPVFVGGSTKDLLG